MVPGTGPEQHLLRRAGQSHRHYGGWKACGSSTIWGPDGRPLAEAGTDQPELITADLDPQVWAFLSPGC